jgi:hypothetical protein
MPPPRSFSSISLINYRPEFDLGIGILGPPTLLSLLP